MTNFQSMTRRCLSRAAVLITSAVLLIACDSQPDPRPTPAAFKTLFGEQPQLVLELDASGVNERGLVGQRRVLTALNHLTEEAWQLPFVQRVDSLTNMPLASSSEDNLWVQSLSDYLPPRREPIQADMLAVADAQGLEFIKRFVSGDKYYIYLTFSPPPYAPSSMKDGFLESLEAALLDLVHGENHCSNKAGGGAVIKALNEGFRVPEGFTLTVHGDFIEGRGASFRKPQLLYASLATNSKGTDLAQLRQLQAFMQWLEDQPEVLYFESPLIALEKVSIGLGEESMLDANGAETFFLQTVLMYEMSLPFGKGLENQLAYIPAANLGRPTDARAAQLVVTLQSDVDVDSFRQRVGLWLLENALDMVEFMQNLGSKTGVPYDGGLGALTTVPAKLECGF